MDGVLKLREFLLIFSWKINMKVFKKIGVTGREENVGFLVLFRLFFECSIESMYLSDKSFEILNLLRIKLIRIFGLLEDSVFHICMYKGKNYRNSSLQACFHPNRR